ncbi:MAG: (4Fe-4S)-binding protein [Syntrophomonas sp.]|nr:(4Fe-4S)-binding protein [Syntrophomonas sp.]
MKEYQTKDLIVYWCPQDCSHAGKCLQGLPDVFDLNRRPWIDLSAGTAEEIIKTIDKCPTRALQYSLPAGSSIDPDVARGFGSKDYKPDVSSAGSVRVIKDGPFLLDGPNRLYDSQGNLIKESDRLVLCRCCKSKKQPFCDGSHILEKH